MGSVRDTTTCTKSDWPYGLFCVGCAKRIVYGHEIHWDTTAFFANAYCAKCAGADNKRKAVKQ